MLRDACCLLFNENKVMLLPLHWELSFVRVVYLKSTAVNLSCLNTGEECAAVTYGSRTHYPPIPRKKKEKKKNKTTINISLLFYFSLFFPPFQMFGLKTVWSIARDLLKKKRARHYSPRSRVLSWQLNLTFSSAVVHFPMSSLIPNHK